MALIILMKYTRAADEQLRELTSSLDYAGTISFVRKANQLMEQAMRTAAPAYPQDTLTGSRQANNFRGLVEALGYLPEATQPIGYLVPNGADNYIGSTLVYPRYFPGEGDAEARWEVANGGGIRRQSASSRLHRSVSRNPPENSAGVKTERIVFDSFEAAMTAAVAQ